MQDYVVTVSSRDCFYKAIAYIAASLLKRDGTSLVFLPGKSEIEEVSRILVDELQIPNDKVHKLHSDLDETTKNRVVRAFREARIVLATSLAQTSLTVPDVDYVMVRQCFRFSLWLSLSQSDIIWFRFCSMRKQTN